MIRTRIWPWVFSIIAVCFCVVSAQAQPPATPPPAATQQETSPQQSQPPQPMDEKTVVQKASMIMAYDLFQQYQAVGVELDVEALINGLRLAAAGEKLPITNEESDLVVNAFNRAIDARRVEMEAMAITENQARSREFLEKNSHVEGVEVLPSGVQYRVLKEGTGEIPTATDVVFVHYTGRLVDGTEFESTEGGEPARFPVSGVIRGMTECLLKMKVGEKCQMAIPSELAYGKNPRPGSAIGPDMALVFDVELLSIAK